MTTPDTDTPKPERCRVCHGWGYLPCDCWPGDCICGFGDEQCENCEGTGEEGWEGEDDDFC